MVFDTPLDVAKQVYSAALAADRRLFLGSVDGQSAVCGPIAQSGDVDGVYRIGVVEEFRSRGIRKVMNWAVPRAGSEASFQVGVL